MKTRTKRFVAIALFVLCCLLPAMSAFAADTAEAIIPAEVIVTGDAPKIPEDYKLVLKADDVSYPMPEGAQNGEYVMTVTGAAKQDFPAIVCDELGIYTYTVHQEPGTNKNCTYDDAEYTLTVYVVNGEQGGFECSIAMYKVGEEEKVDCAVFTNTYIKEPSPVPKTGDENNLIVWYVLMGASLAAIAVVAVFTVVKMKKAK